MANLRMANGEWRMDDFCQIHSPIRKFAIRIFLEEGEKPLGK